MASDTGTLGKKSIVLTVNFLNMFLCAGFPFNMSVLNVEFLRVFGESKAQTALVQAVTIGVLDIAGLVGGQYVNKYGVRKTGMFGGLLAFLGLSSSFFATSIPYLIVSIGIVAGFGFSLTFISCVTSVGEYFDGKAKLVAISFISIGSGCGGMLFPFLLDYLIYFYGWSGCVLIVGGIMGNMICFFAVCEPKLVGVSSSQPEHTICCWQDPYTKYPSSVYPNQRNENRISKTRDNDPSMEQYTCTEKLHSLTKNVVFIIFILGITLTISSFSSALIYMLEFLQTKGFGENEALIFYFYMTISSTLGRIVPGLCILVPFVNGLFVSAFFTSLSCLTSVGLLIATTYYHHVILMCVFGVSLGCSNTVLSMTTMEIVGLDKYAIGIGLLMPSIGVSSIIAGAVSGLVGGQYVNKYGVRKTGMFGGLLAFLGLSSSFFATSIPYLIVSIGIVAGFGFSLTFISCVTSVGEYFDGKAKLVAISFISIGSGCGGMLFPFLLDYLIYFYGWSGCVLIVGGIMGNMICFFALCEPKLVGVSSSQPEHTICCWQDPYTKYPSSVYPNQRNENRISKTRDNDPSMEQYTCTEKLHSLTKNVVFIIFILGITLTISSFSSALIYMLEFLQTKGFGENEALIFYFYMTISSTLGRIVPGLCILVPFVNGLFVSAFFTSLSCLTSVGLLIATTYYHHVILMCVFGVSLGCSNTVLSMTTMEIVGLDKYAIGIGLLMPSIGVSSIIAGAVSGWLVDFTGSYHASYYSVSATQGVAVCLFILAIIIRKCYRSKTYQFDKRTIHAYDNWI